MYANETTQVNFIRGQKNCQIILAQVGERKIRKIIGKTWGLYILLRNISDLQQR